MNPSRRLSIAALLGPVLVLSWQPGPGFVGTYHLRLERTLADGTTEQIPVDVQLRPGQ
jgi:hypothetical protein